MPESHLQLIKRCAECQIAMTRQALKQQESHIEKVTAALGGVQSTTTGTRCEAATVPVAC
jgi:hypothetical protein